MQFTKREVSKGNGEGGTFLKLGDGESVTGVFAGEVFEFFQRWPPGETKQVFDKPTAGASSRFKVNFIVKEGPKFVAKVWEFGVGVYNQLADIHEEYALEETKIKITRRGTGKETVWMILPLLKEPIPAKVLKEIQAVPLNNLGAPVATQPDGPVGDDSGLPF